ncbi:hypothetical protein [Novosphingobium sp. M1R2S20]|uniref:Uncharacterized protein n=1 Tax=Novosphingobium rhizovicinum TaxID=3228928 RepID=A0ABV3R9Z8_9SPHN
MPLQGDIEAINMRHLPLISNLHADDDSSEAELPELRLFQAVIINALQEAVGKSAAPDPHAIIDARRWFHDADRDFHEVCAWADVDPIAMRSAALAIIAQADAEPGRRLWKIVNAMAERALAA